MSDAIYDDVITTESERVEMMVVIYESADCVRDHNFRTETNTHQPLQQTESDCVKIRSSRSAVVCLVLLCVLLLTAVIVQCVHIHINNTNYTGERDQLLTKINNLTEERDQLLTNNTNLIQLTKKFLQEKNELKCLYEMDKWIYYQSSCYYISSEKKSWTESRRYCTEKGADLIIVNNREEQNFVMNKSGNLGVWIGLTGSDVEGTWKWVDGSTLTSGFWVSGAPNGGRAENRVVSFSSGWTESERVEMMVIIYESTDCVRDLDFRTETNTHQPLQRTGNDSVKIRSSRSAVVCLVLLCVLLLTAVIVLCVHIHTNNTNYTEEKMQILTNNTDLVQLNKKLIQEKNELLKCLYKTDGWFYYHSSCYYISSEWKNWTESRRYCTERGADLIINNEDEQNFIMKTVGNYEAWIDLTDTDVEGTWKWVDGSTMTSGFWKSGEPNGDRKENCVVSY
ncbi:uncharacterized protein LOC127172293 [Labeo rohita]|uniref:uncharacterized protein LOC127172293 n=1 Tax=Labeo rohita TaxID=84645 RepID=UPI0021E22D65|nr:uncharacterized protein LOC127172293 [Labeo rohita]